MALTTYDAAVSQLQDNMVWEGSVSKASLFLEAARWLQFNRAKWSARAGAQLQFESLQPEIDRASAYVSSVSSTAMDKRAPFVRGIPL